MKFIFSEFFKLKKSNTRRNDPWISRNKGTYAHKYHQATLKINFHKNAPNSFYDFKIDTKPLCDTPGVFKTQFWIYTSILSNFFEVDFLTSRCHFCIWRSHSLITCIFMGFRMWSRHPQYELYGGNTIVKASSSIA